MNEYFLPRNNDLVDVVNYYSEPETIKSIIIANDVTNPNKNTKLVNFNRYLNNKAKKSLLNDRKISLIEYKNHNGTNKLLILSYYSSEDSTNLNEVAVTSNTALAYRIRCRHLAIGYLQNSFYFSEINTIDKLSKHPCFDTDNFLTYCSKLAKESYYFELSQLPYVLQLVADEISEIDTYRAFLFGTTTHLMGIKIKKNNTRIIIRLYDPNETLRDKKIILHQTKDIINLNLNHLFSQQDIRSYFPEKIASAYLLSIETTTGDYKTNVVGRFNPTLGYLMLLWGHFTTCPRDMICFSNSFNSSKGIHGLAFALYLNRSIAVKNFVAVISNSELSDAEKYRAFNVYFDDAPILLCLIQNNKFDMVITYTSCILTANLNNIFKYMLLQNLNSTTGHAIKRIIATGDVHSVKNYTQLILLCDLPVNYIMKLLYIDVDPTLKYTLSFDSNIIRAVNTYINLIDCSLLDKDDKIQLTCQLKSALCYYTYQDNKYSTKNNDYKVTTYI